MRILCLDVGEKRIGVAVSDPLDLTAQGVTTIWTRGHAQDAAEVLRLCGEYGTNRILCGLPRNMDGSEGFRAKAVRDFAALLSETGAPEIVFRDERLTTVSAHQFLNQTDTRGKKRKQTVDAVAAVIILQEYLDFRKNQKK